MGYYIQVPENKGKAKQIVELYNARILPEAPPFHGLQEDEAAICVIDNGPFEAAGFAFSADELHEFTRPDGRTKTWLIMSRSKACELTGYDG